ncbi:hypothetical protein ALC152_16680 [Arcobacter sp. 15-2]|uniref:PP0621 family protein n=1 Tax=Arcobacter sp. 15-2 TaxID=3374109 RepID=UPI00399CB6B3
MIIKLLILAAVLFGVYLLFFKKAREKNIKDNESDKITDTMLECPTCGTYVSKDDAILSSGKYFCSQECLK